jgi:hypothetical protein
MVQVEIRPTAATLLADYGPLAALVLLPDEGDECCRVGFDVVALPAGEAVPPGLVPLGTADGVPLYATWAVESGQVARVLLARDEATDSLTAVLL